MFESILSFEDVEKKPWLMLVWGVVLASIAILISAQIAYRMSIAGQFVNLSGLFSVLFIIIPSAYYMTMLIKKEEVWEEDAISRMHLKSFWEKHGSYIMMTMAFFTGLTLAFSAWGFVLPGDFFQVQSSKINQIQGVAGQVTGEFTKGDLGTFVHILSNNAQVTAFAFLFSLLFGAGAIFIIAWNASILGVYIGQLSKHVLEIPWWGMQFLPHGIPEIGGYLLAGLAGGIISAAVLRKNDRRVMKLIVMDSMKIMSLALGLIVVGAAIEVYM